MFPRTWRNTLRQEVTVKAVRSSGPGGQNVNKVNSKVEIRWHPRSSALFAENPEALARFEDRYARRIAKSGDVIVTSDTSRDQGRNREIGFEKLEAILEVFLRPVVKRKKTKPSKGSKERRMQSKKLLSKKKMERKRAY